MSDEILDVVLARLGTNWWSRPDLALAPSNIWEPLAEISYMKGGQRDDAMQVLVRHRKTGFFARRLAGGGAIRTIDSREAARALLRLEGAAQSWHDRDHTDDVEKTETPNDQVEVAEPPGESAARKANERVQLAQLVKAWRGDTPVSRAAQLLDMPQRTVEGIEQGRGFRYARLLILAMRAMD